MPDDDVLYAQRTGPWGRRVCVGLLVAIAVGGFAVELDRGFGFAVASGLAYAGAFGIPLWVALLTLWSIDRYGAILVTRTTLRVGRARVPVADVSAADVLHQLQQDPVAAPRWAHVTSPGPLPDPATAASAPLLGGAFGSTAGSPVVTLWLEGLGWRRVDVKRPVELLEALLRARLGVEPRT